MRRKMLMTLNRVTGNPIFLVSMLTAQIAFLIYAVKNDMWLFAICTAWLASLDALTLTGRGFRWLSRSRSAQGR